MTTFSPLQLLSSARDHVPLQAQNMGIQVALLPLGVRTKPVDQILYIGGSFATVTVDDVTTANAYTLVIGGTSVTYSATASDTKKTVAYNLMIAANAVTATTGVTAEFLREGAGGDWVFNLYKPTGSVFTLANTGTTTPAELDVSAVTNSGTAIAKGATTIALTNTLLGAIQANQYLQAVDADGFERLIKLSATANTGASSLAVSPVAEGIAAGSRILFPPELFDRTEANSSSSTAVADLPITNNSSATTDAVITSRTVTVSLGGNWFEDCPGANTAIYADNNQREFWLRIVDPIPRDGFLPRIEEGAAILTGREKTRPVGQGLTNSLSARFVGEVYDTPAQPIV